MKQHLTCFGFLVLVFTVWIAGCSEEVRQTEEVLRPVRYQVVSIGSGEKIRTYSGSSVASEETHLSFRVSGSLQRVLIKVGQQVLKGDLIAELDARDLQLKYEEANAAVLNSQVQEKSAKANLNRLRELYENNNVALSEYEQAKNSYSAAKADYSARLKQRDLQRSQLRYSKLVAPMPGIVSSVLASQNENINAGQVIAVLSSSDDIEIKVGVPETYIAEIKSGGKVSVKFSSIPEKTFSGVVSEVSYAADYSTFPVTISLTGDTSKLRPGMAAEVNFSFTAEEGKGLIIPANSVAEDQAGNYVFLLRDSGESGVAIIERAQVVVGDLTKNGFVVQQGLKEGDLVVTTGISKISDGMRVRFEKTMQNN